MNNAAIAPRRREETPEGVERQLATNVFGYFWMIKAFRDHLNKSAPARIVNVASYWAGDLDLNDLEFKRRGYDNDTAYRQSKQADRMLTAAFAHRLAGQGRAGQGRAGQGIAVNACHPGDAGALFCACKGYG